MSNKNSWTKAKKWSDYPKGAKITLKIIGIIIVLIILIAIFAPREDTDSQVNQNNVNDQSSKQENEETLSKRVEKAFLKSWEMKDTKEFFTQPDMPDESKIYGFISTFEDISSGTVRVYVQTDIDEVEAKKIGNHIMGTVGFEIEELDWVVIRGIDGRDVNYSRSDIPALR